MTNFSRWRTRNINVCNDIINVCNDFLLKMITAMSQPGYLLFLGHSLNMEKMVSYSAAVSPVHKQYGGTYIGIGGPGHGTELLEGDCPME